MPATLRQRWSDLRRQLRLAVRLARYGRASFAGGESQARTAALTTLFRTTNAFLRGLDVDHVLAFGTLLGWHRQRGILAHDRDVDFAAPLAAYDRIRSRAAQLPPGYALHDTSHRHPGPKLYVSHRGWEADIYFYAEADGQLRVLLNSRDPGDVAPFPRELVFPRQPADFLGEPTFVPAQPERLLRHHYGYIGADAVQDPVTRYYRPRNPAADPGGIQR